MQVRVDQLKVGEIVQVDNHINPTFETALHVREGSIGVVVKPHTHVHGVAIMLLSDSGNGPGPNARGEIVHLRSDSLVSVLDADFFDDEGNCVFRTYANQEEVSHEPLVAQEHQIHQEEEADYYHTEAQRECINPGCFKDAEKDSYFCATCLGGLRSLTNRGTI